MSNKTKVAELIEKAHDTQIHQNDALLLMRPAVILHKVSPEASTFHWTFRLTKYHDFCT